MNPSSSHPPGSAPPDAAASAGSRAYTPGLSDGLGDRLMMFDAATQSSLELLRFKREFSDAPGFEEAVRERIEELSRFKHPSVAPVRAIQSLDDGLALVSANTPGRRLSEMVHVARGAPFAMDLIQQLAPALAALHQQGGRVAHGLLTAERIIITREGRLVVVEHVLATAFEQLRLSATRLRTELGIAVPNSADPVGLNQRSDVVQLGFLALSLLLGRRLDPAHFPTNIGTLLDEFTHADAASSAKLRPWLERALQVNERAFASAEEAHAAFSESEGKPRESRPAPPAVTVTKESSVLAFRPTKGEGTGTPLESKSDASKADKKDSSEPVKIELQKLDPPPAPPPVISVASPRVKQGGAGKWIAIAVVIAAVAGGALYMSGMLSGSSTPESSTPQGTTTTPPTATTPVPPPPPFRPEPAPATTPGPATPPTAAPLPDATTASSAGNSSTGTGGSGTAGSGRLAAGTTPAQSESKQNPPAEKPVPAAGGFGGVKVSAPVELKVFENGNLVGSTAGPIAVLQGTHTFEVVNEALAFRMRSTVNVRGGQLTPLVINLPNGRLSINAVPWADVFIDGKAAGQTPLANVPIQIGQHEIVFRHPQLGEERQTVTVKAEGLTKVSATFKQ
jgi:hypothetical protein